MLFGYTVSSANWPSPSGGVPSHHLIRLSPVLKALATVTKTRSTPASVNQEAPTLVDKPLCWEKNGTLGAALTGNDESFTGPLRTRGGRTCFVGSGNGHRIPS